MEAAMHGFYGLDDTVCFYKDTVNRADKKLVCVFHQEYGMLMTRKLTYRIRI